VRKFSALLLVLAASCSTPEVKPTDNARKSFDAWAQAARSGDAEKTLAGFSDAKKSEWLYQLLEDNDPIARRWRGELTGTPRTQLDLWWGVSHKRGNGRDEILNAGVLYHPSFAKMFREYFMQTANSIRDQFSRLEIAQVYGDDSGITVAVKCVAGAPTELYGLVYERDGWKIDTYRQPLSVNK
jgi:hypothetical protein